MSYPVSLSYFDNNLSLFVPVPDEVKSLYEKRREADPKTAFPFWAKCWPSARALSDYLKRNPDWVQDKTVLEIGAGIGLPSFSVAGQAQKIILSDHDPEAVELMQKNISHAALKNAEALCLDWNDFPEIIKADTVLLSDINYEPAAFFSLLKLIRRFLTEGADIIIATPQRIMGAPFIQDLQPWIRQTEIISIKEKEGDTAIQVMVLQS